MLNHLLSQRCPKMYIDIYIKGITYYLILIKYFVYMLSLTY
jgi:hypothetical protein